MRRLLFLCGHFALLAAAFAFTSSTSGFVVTGFGLALLLDRYLTRLLPWNRPVYWLKELGLRGGSLLVGAVAFYLMRPGIVPLGEAAYRGFIVSLVAFLLEVVVEQVTKYHADSPSRAWRWKFGLRSVLLGTVAIAAPVIVTLHPLHTVPKRGPDAMGLAFDDVRFQTADGVTLAGWVVPHVEARGNVIFCHGHGRNRGHVAGLLPTFHNLGLNVLAFDFRGHGDSEGHTSTFGHREVGDLLAAASYLRARFPDQPLFLAGISLGAAVTLQALPLLPEVQGVWSEGCFSHLTAAIENEFAWLPAGLRAPMLSLYHVAGYLDCGFWAPAVNPLDSLSRVNVPIYFTHGEQDELVPIADGKALYDAYRGPKRHWWVENASHYDVRQRHREEYLERLRSFFEERLLAQGMAKRETNISAK